VPLFLLWANLLWTIVLAGALFVRTLSEHSYGNGHARLSDIRAILQCLGMFRAKSQTGDIVTDQDCLQSGISLVHWQTLRALLVKNKWIAVTDNGAYSLCRDLQSVTVWDVACLVDMPINEAIPDKTHVKSDPYTEHWLNDYFTRRADVEGYARNAFDITLDDLFTQKKDEIT
jgi:membrane protein